MLLRDELETALNDLVVLCEDAADAYASAAESLDDAGLATLLRDFAGQRRAMAAQLGVRVRERGDIPRGADPDFEAARALFGRLKALFAPDQRRSLLDHCAAADQDLIERLTEAHGIAGEAALQAEVDGLRAQVEAGLARLAEVESQLEKEAP